MSQMNVYMIPASADEQDVLKSFVNPNWASNTTKIYQNEKYRDYNFYEYCEYYGGIVSKIADKDIPEEIPYEKYVMDNYKNKLKHLYEIKELQQQPDYKKELKKFKRKFYKLSEIYNNKINEGGYECEEELPEYQAFMKFLDENKLMDDSMMYPLKPDRGLPFVTVHEEISNVENLLAKGYQPSDEFINIKNSIQNLLDVTTEVTLFSYWMDDTPTEHLTKGETIHLNELTENILARLPNCQTLTIIK